MSGAQPDSLFVKQIRAALTHWRVRTQTPDDEMIACLDEERQNLYRSIQYGLVLPETWQDAATVVYQSFPLIERRGYWREWIPLLHKVIADCSAAHHSLQFLLLNQLGELLRRNRDLDASVDAHQEAEALAQQMGDTRRLAETYAQLSETYFRQNKLDAAESCGEAALNKLTELGGSEHWLANVLQTLGNIARWRLNSQLAQERLLAAASIRRQWGSPLLLARALNDLGMAYRLAGERLKAHEALSEAAAILTPSFYELDKSMNRLNTGCLHYDDKQWAEAERYFRQSDSTYVRQFGNVEYQARVNHHIGNALLRQKKYREAAAYFERAVALWEEAGDEIELANTLDSLGEAREGLREKEVALSHYRKASQLLQRYPKHERAGYLLKEIKARPIVSATL